MTFGETFAQLRERRFVASGCALVIYVCLSLVFFGTRGDWSETYFGGGADPIAYIWLINWWPYAIIHGLNPFITHFVWFPAGFNLTWCASVPFASLLGVPVTLLGGPVLTFNIFSVLSPAVSAWTAFLLTRYLTGRWAAALVAGYLFGFSSYELGQVLGHLNLDTVFLVPLVILVCVKRVRNDIGRRRFVAGLTVLLLAELGLSTEILATLGLFGAMTWLMFLAFGAASDRPRLLALAVDICVTGVVTLVCAAPFLFYMVKGLPDVPPVINSATMFSADLLNFVFPTVLTHLGRSMFSPIAQNYSGNASEQGAYIGLPLLIILFLYFQRNFGSRPARALLLVIVGLAICSLGPALHVGGVLTHLWLPWDLALRVPLISSVLPTRFSMYTELAAAIVTALFLAAPGARGWRWALAILACIFLLPNTSQFGWTAWPRQDFFTPTNARQALGRAANVLVIPLEPTAPAKAWQLNTGMAFTQSAGYVGFTPRNETGWGGLDDLRAGMPGPDFNNDLDAFCATHAIDDLLIMPSTPAVLVAAVTAQGWPRRTDHGVLIVKVPPPGTLKYAYIRGDYWPSPAPFNWMGRRIEMVTHGQAETITLSGRYSPEPFILTQVSPAGTATYRIGRMDNQVISIPANTDVTFTADHVFRPADRWESADSRDLSIMITIAPAQ